MDSSAQEKIQEVNRGVAHALTAAVFLYISIALFVAGAFIVWQITPQNIISINTLVSVLIGGIIGTTLFTWWTFDAYEPRQWKKFFWEEFSEINASSLEQTISKLEKIHDNSFSYRRVATALVSSLHSTPENPFDEEVKKIYNTYCEGVK